MTYPRHMADHLPTPSCLRSFWMPPGGKNGQNLVHVVIECPPRDLAEIKKKMKAYETQIFSDIEKIPYQLTYQIQTENMDLKEKIDDLEKHLADQCIEFESYLTEMRSKIKEMEKDNIDLQNKQKELCLQYEANLAKMRLKIEEKDNEIANLAAMRLKIGEKDNKVMNLQDKQDCAQGVIQ